VKLLFEFLQKGQNYYFLFIYALFLLCDYNVSANILTVQVYTSGKETDRSNNGDMGSYPARYIDICPYFSVFLFLSMMAEALWRCK